MGIPVGVSYSSTAKGGQIKHVHCEQCQVEYVYYMERLVVGESTSWLYMDNQGAKNAAQRQATSDLARQLRTDCDPVPCPACGWYQRPMQELLKKQHRRWMFFVGCVLLAVCFFAVLFVVSQVLSPMRNDQLVFRGAIVAIASLGVGVGLIVIRARFGANYDPNMTPLDQRRALAKDKAMLRQDFDRLAEDEQKKADAAATSIEEGHNPSDVVINEASTESPLAFLENIHRKRRRR